MTDVTYIASSRRRTVLRAVWVITAAILILNWIPRVLAGLDKNLRLNPAVGQLLQQAHLPLFLPGTVTFLLDVGMMVTFAAAAFILFWRRGNNWLALLTGMMFIATAHGYAGERVLVGVFFVVGVFGVALMETLQVTFFFLFPGGKLTTRWWRWGWVVFFLFRLVIWWDIYTRNAGQGALEVGVIVALIAYGIFLQVRYYRRHSTPTERQQVKWMLIGFTTVVVIVVPSVYLLSIIPLETSPDTYILLLGVQIVRTLAFFIAPISIGFAILRYRLWDIDFTVNRALVVMGILLTLLLVFTGTLVMLNSALGVFLGSRAQWVAIAAALIAVLVLLRPTRRLVRRIIDRRLYGFRFDLSQLRAAQRPPQVLHPGTLTNMLVGGYQVLDILGYGGMGEVYKAFQSGQLYALKFLPKELAARSEFRSRFQREAAVLARLDHPTIIKLYGSGEQDGLPYIVLDYVTGKDLESELQEKHALPAKDALPMILELADALEYAHKHNLVHRDVKPANVLLRAAEEAYDPVLTDFGIAKDLNSQEMSEGVSGTLHYMAPEQILESATIDQRADIYALGVLCFRVFTGKLPFEGEPGHVLFAHLYQPAPDPHTIRPDLPKNIVNALLRALAKNPEDRFHSVKEFALALAS